MLDERQIRAVEAKAKGFTITDVAKEAGVSRNTVYEWIKLEEFKAELSRFEQDFLSSTKQAVISYGPIVVEELKKLATKGKSEKVRLDALSKLLDKTMSNANKIELSDTRDTKDNVPVDVLDKEIEEFDNE
ncbi:MULTISPECIES: phBC6A51 family helix-turn-helix protein [Clostridium]|uniref:PhBC6A51 family helix-turn-helix protein n=1 Tax=Clostridium frigoriphilum TaxID=443253 RepID=A0ABU7UJ46_9CLOT|nr:phBC6A51 family helix-turn-helix protein [Clostridium sp. DSM 17811]MBU3098369.1 helix-turn-helix domain-containing protein [Clostridium sp. DSM 17811]